VSFLPKAGLAPSLPSEFELPLGLIRLSAGEDYTFTRSHAEQKAQTKRESQQESQ
jgi:hypothetical protein